MRQVLQPLGHSRWRWMSPESLIVQPVTLLWHLKRYSTAQCGAVLCAGVVLTPFAQEHRLSALPCAVAAGAAHCMSWRAHPGMPQPATKAKSIDMLNVALPDFPSQTHSSQNFQIFDLLLWTEHTACSPAMRGPLPGRVWSQ